MKMMVTLGTCAAIALACSCGGRSVAGGNLPDGSPPGRDAGTSGDGSVSRDAGPDGGTTCEPPQHLLLGEVALTRLEPMQFGTIYEGQTVRVLAGVEYGGCESFGQITYAVDRAARVVTVTAKLWRAQSPTPLPCPDFLAYAEDYLVLSDLAPGTWRVVEGRPSGGGLETRFDVTVCDGNADCLCLASQPLPGGIDDACNYDCECQRDLRCLTHAGFAGEFKACGRSCSVDAQCYPGESCRFIADGPYGVCGPLGPGQGCETNGCPTDMACVVEVAGAGGYCRAVFTETELDAPCGCDADCRGGLRCARSDAPTTVEPTCQYPCRGDRECASGAICGATFQSNPTCLYLRW